MTRLQMEIILAVLGYDRRFRNSFASILGLALPMSVSHATMRVPGWCKGNTPTLWEYQRGSSPRPASGVALVAAFCRAGITHEDSR